MRAGEGSVGTVRAEEGRRITKADSVALWHAVQAMSDLVRAMKDMDFTQEQKDAEALRLGAAKKALRKVQAQVRADRNVRAAA